MAIDRAGRTEDEATAWMLRHVVQQIHQAAQVVLVVLQGLLNRLPDRFVGRKVDDAVEVLPFEGTAAGGGVGEVDLEPFGSFARNSLNAVQDARPRIAQIVHQEDLIALSQ